MDEVHGVGVDSLQCVCPSSSSQGSFSSDVNKVFCLHLSCWRISILRAILLRSARASLRDWRFLSPSILSRLLSLLSLLSSSLLLSVSLYHLLIRVHFSLSLPLFLSLSRLSIAIVDLHWRWRWCASIVITPLLALPGPLLCRCRSDTFTPKSSRESQRERTAKAYDCEHVNIVEC